MATQPVCAVLCSMGGDPLSREIPETHSRRGNILEGGSLSPRLGHGIEKGLFIEFSTQTSSSVPPKAPTVNRESATSCPSPCLWAYDPNRLHLLHVLSSFLREADDVGGPDLLDRLLGLRCVLVAVA